MSRVKYKIRVVGLQTPDGTISFKALKEIVGVLLECSERGLRLAVQGESIKPGKVPAWLSKSIDFTMTGLETGSTVLDIEAPILGETAREQIVEQDLWYSKPSQEDTAISLLSKSIKDTTSENLESDTYDAGVLEGLLSFESVLKNFAKQIEIESEERPEEHFELGCEEIEKIRRLKTHTPEPMAFVIAGRFDMIQHSSKRFHLLLADGQSIPGAVDPDFLSVEDMRQWWGKKVTIKGMVHFRPSGKVRLIEAQVIKPMTSGEEVFERMPAPPETMELFEHARRTVSPRSPLTEVWNKWPGDESIEEILAALRE
jgi:hypothetical protein